MILITGGAGFIGLHTLVELAAAGHKLLVLDNLCNSSNDVIQPLLDCDNNVHGTQVLL